MVAARVRRVRDGRCSRHDPVPSARHGASRASVRTAWLRLARLGAADRGFRRDRPRRERHSIRMAHLLIVPGGVAGPALQSVASIVAPVAFTQLFAWTIAA